MMLKKAMQVYGNRADWAAQIARTASRLSQTESALGHADEADTALSIGKRSLQRLSSAVGRTVSFDELDTFTPQWAK